MKYYKGACEKDTPSYGGSFVEEHGYGHEEYNFLERRIERWEDDSGIVPDGSYCLGFVETKQSVSGTSNQLRLERIIGCSSLSKELSVSRFGFKGFGSPFIGHFGHYYVVKYGHSF